MLNKFTKLFGFVGSKPTMRTKEEILAEYDASTNKMVDGARISLEVALDVRDLISKRAVMFNLAPVNINHPGEPALPDGIVRQKDGSVIDLAGGGMQKTASEGDRFIGKSIDELTAPQKCEYGTVGCESVGDKHACTHPDTQGGFEKTGVYW